MSMGMMKKRGLPKWMNTLHVDHNNNDNVDNHGEKNYCDENYGNQKL